jgi:hypothetical protein
MFSLYVITPIVIVLVLILIGLVTYRVGLDRIIQDDIERGLLKGGPETRAYRRYSAACDNLIEARRAADEAQKTLAQARKDFEDAAVAYEAMLIKEPLT